MKQESSVTTAQQRVLDLVKRFGPATAADLAERLGMTDVAVRQHLAELERQGLISSERLAPEGRGRPSAAWSVTPAANGLFPDAHAELTVGLVRAIREAVGEPGLKRIVEVRARDQRNVYRSLLPSECAPLGMRLESLARQRTAEGYMAEVREEPDGRFLLIEHHCPICDAARECSGLCSGELAVFREVLGRGVRVERIEHLLSEGRRCVYEITEDR